MRYSDNGGLQIGDYDLNFGAERSNYYSAEQFNGSEEAFNSYIKSYNQNSYGQSSSQNPMGRTDVSKTAKTATRVSRALYISAGSAGSNGFNNLFGGSSSDGASIPSSWNLQSLNSVTFISYVSNIYGSNIDRSKISIKFPVNDTIKVSPVDYRSTSWGRDYGFTDPQISAFGSMTYYDCTSSVSGASVLSYGLIRSIVRNQIRISDRNGFITSLKLGSCSILEGAESTRSVTSIGGVLPRVGNTISWKGISQLNGASIRVKQATFY